MKKYILPIITILTLSMYSCNEEATKEEVTQVKAEVVNELDAKVNNESSSVENINNTKVKNTPNTQQVAANSTSIKVDRMVHDFGTLTTKTPVTTKFTVTNTGNEPLVITNAKGSCGCTVPDWPKEPIAPGSTGTIDVTFSPKGNGSQSKTVTIMANTEPINTVLTVKSTVEIK